MICPQCQSENRDGAKFCDECGCALKIEAENAEAAVILEEPQDNADGGASGQEDALEQEDGPLGDEPSADDAPAAPFDSGQLDIPEIIQVPEIDLPALDGEEAEDGADEADQEDAEAEQDAPDDNPSAALTMKIPAVTPAADLSGIDECLIDGSYQKPKAAWKSGDTMQMPRIESDAPAPKKEFRAPDKNAKKGKGGKVALIVILIVAVVAAGAAFATYQMELWGGKAVPNVVGMTQTDATQVLQGKGFAVRATQVKSDETEGVVLLMDPSTGSRAQEGDEVVIHVAIARTIPDVVGKGRDEAQQILETEGFENVTFEEQKSDATEGSVLSITPEKGQKSTAAAPITVVFAVPFTVPDVTSMGASAAENALLAEGFATQYAYIYDDSVAEGTLLGTNPTAGTKVTEGSIVVLNVAKSRGTELVEAARSYLKSGGTVSIGGTSYVIQSLDSVSYAGNDQTTFTITGSAVTTLDGETVYGSAKQKSGTITWDSANNVVSIG